MGSSKYKEPCANDRDDFFRFRLYKFGTPFRDRWDLVYPDRKGSGIVAGCQGPGVREAGGGVGNEFWGGPCQVCSTMISGW